MIYENVDPEANIIFGALVDPEAKSELSWRAEFCAGFVLCGFFLALLLLVFFLFFFGDWAVVPRVVDVYMYKHSKQYSCCCVCFVCVCLILQFFFPTFREERRRCSFFFRAVDV